MARLDKLRKGIDSVDKEILDLFLKRMDLVEKVIENKKKNNKKIYDPKREEKILKQKVNLVKSEELKPFVKDFFVYLMNSSKKYQQKKYDNTTNESCDEKIGYLGKKGSFSYIAAKKYFGDKGFTSFNDFEIIFKKVNESKIDYGILPIENTSTGSIIEVYDLLRKYDLNIVGEKSIEIRHHLLAKKKVKLKDINTVYSHPQAIKQSKEFLQKNNLEYINKENTSISALNVSESKKDDIAAIASKEASEIYGLNILRSNINYNSKNITRFIIIAKRQLKIKDANKLSLGFSVKHTPGSLYDVLKVFNESHINLFKIESRPILGSPFEYYFYVDIEGNLKDDNIKMALKNIKQNVVSMKIFGNYKGDKK